MSHQCARLFPQVQVPLVLAVAALLFVAWPADAGDTACRRLEPDIERGDHLRMLRVWVCGYSSDSGVAERGRVIMATYRRVGNDWYSVTSQTITLESADLFDTKDDTGIDFGKLHGNDTCRIGSPAGSIGCSVPNTKRVTFYGPAWNVPPGHQMFTTAFYVSWRDDQGSPHRLKWVGLGGPPWTSK
jgi:hypothetical protein